MVGGLKEMMQETPQATMSLEEILQGLNNPKFARWEQARLAARKLAVEYPDQLLDLARMEAKVYRKRAVFGTVVSLSLVSVALALAIILQNGVLLFGVAVVSLSCAGWLGLFIPTRARRTLLEVLRTLNDPRFLGSMLTILVPNGVTEVKASVTLDTYVRKTIIAVLLKMLPFVRQEHRAYITPAQMRTLLTLLWQSRTHVALAVAILRALQHIGDESAFPTLHLLAARNDRDDRNNPMMQTLWGANRGVVAEEAINCLKYLQTQADARRQSHVLLRASSQSHQEGQDNLLRPAIGDSNRDPDELLRPLKHSD